MHLQEIRIEEKLQINNWHKPAIHGDNNFVRTLAS